MLVKDICFEKCSFIHLLIDWSWMQMSMLLNYPWSTLLVRPNSWKVFWTRWTTYANAQHQVVMVSNVIQPLKLNFLVSDKYLCCIGMKKLIWHWIVFVVVFILYYVLYFETLHYCFYFSMYCKPYKFLFWYKLYTLCPATLYTLMFPRATFLPYISVAVFCFVFCFFRYPSTYWNGGQGIGWGHNSQNRMQWLWK